jgi:aarF domain-containing kinase
MKVDLKTLIASLPHEIESEVRSEASITQKQLQEIFADLARRPVPVGSLHRLWTVGELSTQIALAYFAYWVRQWFADADKRKQQLIETNLRVSLKMIHRLGYLRGAAAKLGQLLGNLPDILPSQIVETLDRLHFDAPPMHYSLLREMVRNELGGDPQDLFDSFDQHAFAAASIGQVHRARLKSGEQVAIKIQYPGIARAIDSDLRNLGALLFPARLGKDWENTKAQFDEIHRMLKLEVDYDHEAQNMRHVRKLFRAEDGIVVPEVYDRYSTKRVLTTEYIPGVHLNEFMASKPRQAVRNAFADKIYLACTRLYNAHMNYADPHPGNYLFMSDGRLGLLDFGCVQHFTDEGLEILKIAERVPDGPEHLTRLLRRCGATEKQLADKEFMRLMRESCDWSFAPALANGPFDFSDEADLKHGVEILSEIVLKRYTRNHPIWIYFTRNELGVRILLYQLRAQVDVGKVFQSERMRHTN